MSVSAREVFVWMFAASAINYGARLSIAVAGPDVKNQFGLTEQQLGFVFSAFSIAYGVAMTPGGWLSDRVGAARALGLSGIVAAIAMAGTGALGWIAGPALIVPALYSVRLLFGAASAPLYPGTAKLATAWFQPGQWGTVQGAVVGASSLGASLSPIAVAYAAGLFGWQNALVLVGAAMFLFFIAWVWRIPNQRTAASPAGSYGLALLGNRTVLLLAAASAGMGYTFSVFDYWIFYYFREIRGMSSSASAVFTGIAQFLPLLSMPLGGWLSDRMRRRSSAGRAWFCAVVLPLAALPMWLGAAADSPGVSIALFSFAFGAASMTEAALWTTAIDSAPAQGATAGAIVNTGGCLGSFSAPMLVPALAARFGWSGALASVGIVAVLGCFFWVLVGLKIRPARRAVSTLA